jgi:hypothetical protein
MKVHFLAALILGTIAAASSQANNNLRGKKHHHDDSDYYWVIWYPPFDDWNWGGSSKGHKGRKSAPTSSITTTNNKCEECSSTKGFMTMTGERMHAEISPGQCEEACVVAETKGRWEAAGWKCGPCPE